MRRLLILAFLFLTACAPKNYLAGTKFYANIPLKVERRAEGQPSIPLAATENDSITAIYKRTLLQLLSRQKALVLDADLNSVFTDTNKYFRLVTGDIILEEKRNPKYIGIDLEKTDEAPPDDMFTFVLSTEIFLYNYNGSKMLGKWTVSSSNVSRNYAGPGKAEIFRGVYEYLAQQNAEKTVPLIRKAIKEYNKHK